MRTLTPRMETEPSMIFFKVLIIVLCFSTNSKIVILPSLLEIIRLEHDVHLRIRIMGIKKGTDQ